MFVSRLSVTDCKRDGNLLSRSFMSESGPQGLWRFYNGKCRQGRIHLVNQGGHENEKVFYDFYCCTSFFCGLSGRNVS